MSRNVADEDCDNDELGDKLELGDGRPSGGTEERQRHCFEMLDRIRSVSYLTPPQHNTWEVFKAMLDEKSRLALGTTWGRVFAEETKQILVDMQSGSLNVLRKWMANDRQRVLPNEECLILPAVDRGGYVMGGISAVADEATQYTP